MVTRGPTTEAFMTLPLLRQFFVLDMELGLLVVHQVRRDPHTGLTFTQRAIMPEHKGELPHG